MKITAIAGGVGGAKLVDGLARCFPSEDLSVIVNTGDDFQHFGLNISPDLDTVCYTLAGFANKETGWGRNNESFRVFEEIGNLAGPSWFKLGDLDLATHLERTRRLWEGETLTEITHTFCKKWGIKVKIFPMCDQPVRTKIITMEGENLPFQEYFVKRNFQPEIKEIIFDGIKQASASDEAISCLEKSDFVIFCPSNPFVSIAPIISIENIHSILVNKPILAVSPIINGKALKGPAAKMFQEKGLKPSALEVAKLYKELLKIFILDNQDKYQASEINAWGIICRDLDILMPTIEQRKRLACEIKNILIREY